MSYLAVMASFPAPAFTAAWPWAIIALVALLAVPRRERNAASLLGAAVVGLAWLGLYVLTGDRRMFFPYTIHFAIQAMCLLDGRLNRPGLLGGALSIIVFTAIRVSQGATLAVLSLEAIVAGTVLALAIAAWRRSPWTSATRFALSLAGSLLAFAGLSL